LVCPKIGNFVGFLIGRWCGYDEIFVGYVTMDLSMGKHHFWKSGDQLGQKPSRSIERVSDLVDFLLPRLISGGYMNLVVQLRLG
jgi:hypothetical protein